MVLPPVSGDNRGLRQGEGSLKSRDNMSVRQANGSPISGIKGDTRLVVDARLMLEAMERGPVDGSPLCGSNRYARQVVGTCRHFPPLSPVALHMDPLSAGAGESIDPLLVDTRPLMFPFWPGLHWTVEVQRKY